MAENDSLADFTKGVYDSRDLRLAHPIFIKVFPDLQIEFGLETGMKLNISCTYRSPKAQKDLYAKGRDLPPFGKYVTHCDGYKTLSKHNKCPSEAIDTYITFGGKIVWELEAFKPLGELAPRFGLYWGGFGLGKNKDFIDSPHLELAGEQNGQ